MARAIVEHLKTVQGAVSDDMSKIPRPTEMSQHVQIVFKTLFDELNSMKQQQWGIANYAVLLLAAAFAVKDKVNPYTLLAIVWATAVIGSLLLLTIQWNIGRYRNRIDGLHKAYFTEQELKDMGVSESERRNLGTMTQFEQSRRGWEFISSLIAVLFGGSLLGSCCLFP